jgi:hypothetical protein
MNAQLQLGMRLIKERKGRINTFPIRKIPVNNNFIQKIYI